MGKAGAPAKTKIFPCCGLKLEEAVVLAGLGKSEADDQEPPPTPATGGEYTEVSFKRSPPPPKS